MHTAQINKSPVVQGVSKCHQQKYVDDNLNLLYIQQTFVYNFLLW